VRYSRPVSCPHCHGYGTRSGKPPKSCPVCKGTGHRVQTRWGNRGQTTFVLPIGNKSWSVPEVSPKNM
jgi:DnaJ-class molecular chaperone